jgi:GNAT superfamily N-acetyltransferase
MPIIYRPGTPADSRAVFDIFEAALIDLGQRLGMMAITGGRDPAELEQLWERRRPLFEHLARTAEHFWIAEGDGKSLGYARTILRDGVQELTEFFVLPGAQSAGVGRELLVRAFPREGAKRRVIIATADVRATARYLKAGVYSRFPIYYFGRAPEVVAVQTDLKIEPLATSAETVEALGGIDRAILGHTRAVDHAWLLATREGFSYRRDGQMVGYGYLGQPGCGPFALLKAGDFPAALAHAETHAHTCGQAEIGFEVPLVNTAAVDYMLARGYKLDTFYAFFMSDAPFGQFENYVVFSPPFFF